MKWIVAKIFLSFMLIFLLIGGSYLIENGNIYTENEVHDLPIYSVDTSEKLISISFDVNWAENDYLNSILKVLEKYNVKATFFVMGRWVNYNDENLEKLKTIYEKGNEIGNHSFIHPSFTKISKERMKEEVQKTDEIVEDITGEKPKLFRFPSGDYNKDSCSYMWSLGYKVIQWNVDSVDWKENGADIEYERVKKKIKPGAIILFHNNAKYTPDNLDRILKELSENQYKVVPIGELIYSENSYIDENGIQHRK
ncbi:polysaccharide deacetylase family protein [uncultured Clostridium sp.]|uniref:polysaccharide deacetylase family protein n=1 Tax=uncultured Clostridium sp. TaxID=59620 RepID=UPI0025F9CCB7|nr:polysaccharide deacetylase family protein [uncultured Clostridium sp.]